MGATELSPALRVDPLLSTSMARSSHVAAREFVHSHCESINVGALWMSHEEKIILKLSLKLLQLQSIKDVAGLADLFDDELEAIDAGGKRRNKPEMLRYLLEFPSQALNLSEIRITLFDDTAFETGLLRSRIGGQERCHCYSRLWLQRDASWRLRGFQLTPQ